MKKFCIFIVLLGISFCVNAQNIIQITQNSNSNNTTTKESGFTINGISSSEDIGGVSLEDISRTVDSDYVFANGTTRAYLKNYNNFTVTVLFKLLFDSSSKVRNNPIEKEEVYQVVIPSNETKAVELKHCNCPSCYSLLGMIVRRLRN